MASHAPLAGPSMGEGRLKRRPMSGNFELDTKRTHIAQRGSSTA